MRYIVSIILLAFMTTPISSQEVWTASWATATEYTGVQDMPPSGTLNNRTIRQIIHVSLGGEKLRLHLSNEYSNEDTEIKSIYIADVFANVPLEDIGVKINNSTIKHLTFGGEKSITIPAGGTVVSDAIEYQLAPLQLLSITISYGLTPKNATSHRGSRTTTYIVEGEPSFTDFSTSERTDHWYNIAALDVIGEDNSAIAVIGNSITDGRGTTTNLQNRWTDVMAAGLQQHDSTKRLSVLNLGIGGNSVYYGGLSDPAVKRFDRDILGQANVSSVIVFEGINDLGNSAGDEAERAMKLIECYKQFIQKTRSRGLRIYGATIAPFKGSGYDNGDAAREEARQTVNRWIRESGEYDGVLDFDTLLRDPVEPDRLREEYQSDWLHLNPLGYEVMGKYAAEEFCKQPVN